MLINCVSDLFLLLSSLLLLLLIYKSSITHISIWHYFIFIAVNLSFCVSILKSGKGISRMSNEIQNIKRDTNTTIIIKIENYEEFDSQTLFCLLGFLLYLVYLTLFLVN